MLHSTNIVAICIATYMRPLLLKNCLHSLTEIIVPEKYTPIIIVVDNDILYSGQLIIYEEPVPIYKLYQNEGD